MNSFFIHCPINPSTKISAEFFVDSFHHFHFLNPVIIFVHVKNVADFCKLPPRDKDQLQFIQQKDSLLAF